MTEMTPELFAETLAAAQNGDDVAFTVLFRDVQPAVLRYLRVVAGDKAEDIAGETWVQVVRGLGGFVGDEPAAFRGWVLSIARHRWLDERRARARRPETPFADVPDQPSGSDVPTAVDELMATESALTLISKLPPDQAEVIMLRVVGGLDVARTAELLGKQSGAVRVLAHRGLRRLERVLRSAEQADRL
jgi:RNA polymerase sigma-70 factor, ECF subfamily